MSAHRKPGPAVLGGCAPSSAPRHRRDEGKFTTMNRDYYHSRWPGLAEEQQREADRVAGEEMRLRSESFNRVIRGFSQSARDFRAPTTGGGS